MSLAEPVQAENFHNLPQTGFGRYWQQLRDGLFGSWTNTLVTLATLAILWWSVPTILRWMVLDAVFTGTATDCATAHGACWAFIGAKLRFISFGFFPGELQWRPALAILTIIALLVAAAMPGLRSNRLILLWFGALLLAWTLMAGGWISEPISSGQWGGLAITLLVWVTCFTAAVPLAIVLALLRRSTMGPLRGLSVLYIELMRATPMVVILYIAMLILPMALPGEIQIEKLWRAIALTSLFWSAYVAEVIRGGLQAIPDGQFEAARALGLSYARIMRLVVLPQALRIVIPGLVNLAVGFLLATSLLTVIGIFDLLNAAKASAADPVWLGFYDEAYIFAALVYFAISWTCSAYGRWLERASR